MTRDEIEAIRKAHLPCQIHTCDAFDIDGEIDMDQCDCNGSELWIGCHKCCDNNDELLQACMDWHIHTTNPDDRCDAARLLVHIDALTARMVELEPDDEAWL